MVRMASKDTVNVSKLKYILKGSLYAIVISLVLLFCFAICLTYTKVSENTMPITVISITAISILIGSSITTTKMYRSGIFYGIIVGLVYMLFLYIVSSIITKKFAVSGYAIIMIIASIVAGAIGGIIGINRKK